VPIVREDQTVSDLVDRARQGDDSAWKDLVHRFAPLVWSICRRSGLANADCEDVSQSIWLRLVEALPGLREPGALPGWLVTTTRRECVRVARMVRSRNFRERTDIGDVDEVADEEIPAADQRLVEGELNAVLRTAFAQLEPRCQQLLVLLMQTPQIPYVEISAMTGMPTGGIGPTRARCLAKLRQTPALAGWMSGAAGEEGA
jgi:RNA polymerase sigma factor (sigma-70 family)